MEIKIIDDKSGRQVRLNVSDWTGNADWENGRRIGTYIANALKRSYINSDHKKGEVIVELA